MRLPQSTAARKPSMTRKRALWFPVSKAVLLLDTVRCFGAEDLLVQAKDRRRDFGAALRATSRRLRAVIPPKIPDYGAADLVLIGTLGLQVLQV